MKVRDLRQTTGVARAANILRDDVYGWFQRESRGIYALTPKGAAALQTFSDVVSQL
jgi:hypothetical protein